MSEQKIIQSDCLDGLRTLADGSVHCCVTSPPYWGLRDYGHDGQIGLEATPEAYVARETRLLYSSDHHVRQVLPITAPLVAKPVVADNPGSRGECLTLFRL